MADVAVITNNLARIADVLTIMAAKAPLGIEVADVVWMSLPISLHLREKVSLKEALGFGNGRFDPFGLLRINIRIIRAIEIIQARGNRFQRFVSGMILVTHDFDLLSVVIWRN